MTQKELLDAFKQDRREQVDIRIGQIPLSPTIGRMGNYNVVQRGVSKTNSATQLASLLAQAPQIAAQVKNIQEKAGTEAANALTEDEIIKALKIANAWEFVKNFPDGINTNIGDSGNNLSGGQKQRLSIARAVLKNSPIMILDEATSALDTESEREVQDALENMMRNRTSIVIAHRLSTIQNADNIIVMKKGEIVEQGKHIDLLEKKGVYHKLVLLQSLD